MLAFAATTCLPGGGNRDTEQKLVVYTTAEGDQLARLKAAFEAEHPQIRLNLVRYSTGVLATKVLTERDATEADVIWGLAGSSMVLLAEAGLLEPYRPKGFEAIPPRYKDSGDSPQWVGLDVWMAAICANTVELSSRGLPLPASWADLTHPRYRGQVVMPNPASSGAGYADVAGWLQLWGEERGWEFMDALHQNIAQYTHSGSKPCKMAGAGEFALGISFDYRGLIQKQKGEPIEVVFPSEGSGWELETAAILRATDQIEAARRLLDWTITPQAMRLYNEGYAIVTLPGIARPLPGMPIRPEAQLIRADFLWAARNRERILKQWQVRYAGKSEPKN
jgi:iron(III) transport system substrate-binding protein